MDYRTSFRFMSGKYKFVKTSKMLNIPILRSFVERVINIVDLKTLYNGFQCGFFLFLFHWAYQVFNIK